MSTGHQRERRATPGSTKLRGPVRSIAGNQPQPDGEDENEHHAQPEAGVAWATATKQEAAVEEAVRPQCGRDTQAEASRRDHDATRRATRCSGAPRHGASRTGRTAERVAEVAPRQVAEIVAVLVEDGSVGAELLPGLDDHASGVPGGFMIRAGSPGTSRTAKKVTVTTPKTTNSICAVRRRTNSGAYPQSGDRQGAERLATAPATRLPDRLRYRCRPSRSLADAGGIEHGLETSGRTSRPVRSLA